MSETTVQQIIDDLDHAQLYMPDDGTMKQSLALASAMLVRCECAATNDRAPQPPATEAKPCARCHGSGANHDPELSTCARCGGDGNEPPDIWNSSSISSQPSHTPAPGT